jgi:hypothetical protein
MAFVTFGLQTLNIYFLQADPKLETSKICLRKPKRTRNKLWEKKIYILAEAKLSRKLQVLDERNSVAYSKYVQADTEGIFGESDCTQVPPNFRM